MDVADWEYPININACLNGKMACTLRNNTVILASVAGVITFLITVHSTCTSLFKLGMGSIEAVGLDSVVGLVSVTSVVGAEER